MRDLLLVCKGTTRESRHRQLLRKRKENADKKAHDDYRDCINAPSGTMSLPLCWLVATITGLRVGVVELNLVGVRHGLVPLTAVSTHRNGAGCGAGEAGALVSKQGQKRLRLWVGPWLAKGAGAWVRNRREGGRYQQLRIAAQVLAHPVGAAR